MAIIYPEMYNGTGKHPYPANDDSSHQNVNLAERIFSVAAGAFLFYKGLKSLTDHPISGVSKMLAGGTLFSRGISGYSLIYKKLGTDSTKPEAINIKQQFIVNKPREEVFRFWRKLENLPLFMQHLESVEQTDPKRSVWKARFAKDLPPLSWEAVIVKERENEFLGWASVDGAAIHNTGKIEFNDVPGSMATEVKIVFSYHVPAGGITTGIARLFSPVIEDIIAGDVRNFKYYIETKEIPDRDGQ